MNPLPWTSFPFIELGRHFSPGWHTSTFWLPPLGGFKAYTPIKCIEAMGGAFEDVVPCWIIDEERSYNTADEGPVFERLGSYKADRKLITLHVKAIEEAAKLLAAKLPPESCTACAPLALNLAVMVYLHELGHALHHWRIQEDLPKIEAETLAQHFTVTSIESFGLGLRPLFDALEAMQSDEYREWRKAGPITWEKCRNIYDEVGSKSNFERDVDLESRPDKRILNNLY